MSVQADVSEDSVNEEVGSLHYHVQDFIIMSLNFYY